MVRIGAVNYLNTKPLVYGLAERAPQAEIIYDLPSRLADGLAEGRFDVALIPSVEFFQDPEYTLVSDACIGCRGPVLSVKLFCRKPVREVQSLALDEGSRTSVALVQILLEQRFGVRPQLLPLPIGDRVEDTPADAVLLIGDRAIHPPADRFEVVWDLGDQWCRWTELPFVFAMWVARDGMDLKGIDAALSQARDDGINHLDLIAEREAADVELSVPQCRTYLTDNLYFRLGPREFRGLERFYHLAVQLGTAPPGFDLRREQYRHV